jgi:hypothetical protein
MPRPYRLRGEQELDKRHLTRPPECHEDPDSRVHAPSHADASRVRRETEYMLTSGGRLRSMSPEVREDYRRSMSPDVSVTVRRETEEHGGERGGGRGGVLSRSSNKAQRVGRPVLPTLELGKLTREEAAICPSIHALHHMRASEQEQGAAGGEDEEEDPRRLRRKMSPPVHVHAVDALLQLEVRKLQSANDKQQARELVANARELVTNLSAFSHHADLVLTRREQRQESRANSNSAYSNSANAANAAGAFAWSSAPVEWLLGGFRIADARARESERERAREREAGSYERAKRGGSAVYEAVQGREAVAEQVVYAHAVQQQLASSQLLVVPQHLGASHLSVSCSRTGSRCN